ncbi:MAG: hypothetical protein QCI82_02055 [Candidatus Thermoplasmatota archaeon]|nr:hypothetical protein [Candidatus Thermoplasmatota archaeon]
MSRQTKEKGAYLLETDKNSLISSLDRDCVTEVRTERTDFRQILLVRYPPKTVPNRY